MQKLFTTLLMVLFVGTSLQAQNAESIARDHINDNWKEKNLRQSDVQGARISDSVPTNTGLHHVYFRQEHAGIPVHAGIYNVSVYDGKVVFSGSSFISNLAERASSTVSSLSADDAIARVMSHLNANPTDLSLVSSGPNVAVYEAASVSTNDIKAELMYMEIDGQVRLGWGMTVWSLSVDRSPFVFVDANNGSIAYEREMMASDNWLPVNAEGKAHKASTNFKAEPSKAIPYALAEALPTSLANTYSVYAEPVESPNYTVPAPPMDARTVEMTTGDPVASPLGWHNDGTNTFTTTQGNNVDAQKSGVETECGATLDCNPALDLTVDPTIGSNVDAARVNLFYWNNIIHDILWFYGFDEVAGNFQETNAGGGLGSDGVTANAQAAGNCNATFGTPADGSNPTMNMFTCDIATPSRDGDFDNGVIAHEYGHGISNRLVGGPGNVSCLNNSEQAGEGYSDLWGLWLTMEAGDAGVDSRGIGTWLLGTGPTGPGVRTHPYTTDNGINPQTYESIAGASLPHGVGHAFASVLWEVNWEMTDQLGFDPDFYAGTGGNNVFMEVLLDALQMMPCNGSQLDTRDAFMAALDVWNTANGDAIDACSIWENAWTERGYGADAVAGGTARGDEVNGSAMPMACLEEIIVTMSATPDPVMAGAELTITIDVLNNSLAPATNVVVSDMLTGPSFNGLGGTTVSYVSDTCGASETGGTWTWNVGGLASMGMDTCDLVVMLPNAPFSTIAFEDEMDDATNWAISNGNTGAIPSDWINTADGTGPDGGTQPASPGSGGNRFFAANVGDITDQYLALTANQDGQNLIILHAFDTETGFDGGVIEVSTDGGTTWVDIITAGGSFVANGYTGTLSTAWQSPIGGRMAFTGNSGGWVETTIDVSGVALQAVPALYRFRMATDESVDINGWWVDDTQLGEVITLCNGADGSSTETGGGISGALNPCPLVISNSLPVEFTNVVGIHENGDIQLSWATASELNNTGFEIEARLQNQAWVNYGFVEGAGTTDVEQAYNFTISDLEVGLYSVRIKQVDFDGAFDYSSVIEVLVPLPYDYQLGDAYPNPFNPTAKFELIVAQDQNVKVELFDMTGRMVKTLFEGMVEANTARPIKIDGSSLPSGSYIYRAVGETFTTPSKSLVLLK